MALFLTLINILPLMEWQEINFALVFYFHRFPSTHFFFTAHLEIVTHFRWKSELGKRMAKQND